MNEETRIKLDTTGQLDPEDIAGLTGDAFEEFAQVLFACWTYWEFSCAYNFINTFVVRIEAGDHLRIDVAAANRTEALLLAFGLASKELLPIFQEAGLIEIDYEIEVNNDRSHN